MSLFGFHKRHAERSSKAQDDVNLAIANLREDSEATSLVAQSLEGLVKSLMEDQAKRHDKKVREPKRKGKH